MFWFVLSVKRKNEIKIASQLTENGHQVYCPTITVVKQWSDRKKKSLEPLISSFIFIKIEEKNRAQVFGVPGVFKYLYYLGKPAKVPNGEIELLQNYLNGSTLTSTIEKIKPGDNHLIADGPFKGKNGVVQEIGKNRIQLVLTELGIKVTLSTVVN